MKDHRHLPWATAALALLSLAAWASPALSAAWIYDRGAILRGEIWRLGTGSLVHFSFSHLAWDLVAFGCTGAWIELRGFRRGRLLVLSAPLIVGVAAFALQPSMARYGGLSGVATATAAFALLCEAAAADSLFSIWSAAFVLLGVQTIVEVAWGHALLAQFGGQTIVVSASSHGAGFLWGSGLAPWRALRESCRAWHPTHPPHDRGAMMPLYEATR